ncbi:MAG: STAS domain-containing protein [Candidatus Riflebacteria bacterium]|nr:STAS domain-containing protein [Candidatus Riflebacteria bacterium]
MIAFHHDPLTHTLTCSISGRMDTDVASQVQREIDAKLAEVADPDLKVIFLMSGVEYIASAFMRVCLTVLKRLPPQHFKFLQCTPFVRKALTVAGFDTLVPISDEE